MDQNMKKELKSEIKWDLPILDIIAVAIAIISLVVLILTAMGTHQVKHHVSLIEQRQAAGKPVTPGHTA